MKRKQGMKEGKEKKEKSNTGMKVMKERRKKGGMQ